MMQVFNQLTLAIVCYYKSWSVKRPGKGNFKVENIDTKLCTHVIYSYARVTADGDITFRDPKIDITLGGYKRFNNLRNKQSNLKTMISLSVSRKNSTIFSQIINYPDKRRKFANNIIVFLKKYRFNGLDIDWEFPAHFGGIPSDKTAYVEFFKLLRPSFDANGLILSAAVSPDADVIDTAYLVPQMVKYLDFVNVMTYDFHGPWDPITGENTPLYAGPADKTVCDRKLNVDFAIQYWIKKGAPMNKLNLGIATYAITFTLKSATNNRVGAPVVGAGKAGPYTRAPGTMAYFEICEKVKSEGWKFYWNAAQNSAYAVKEDQWAGYDSISAVLIKALYIKNNGLGGAMIWSIDMDDYRNICRNGVYPLLRTIKSVL
ncbi:hypothetical protein ANN_18146 [Periplaneta americana]|uniref:GH18 domain-containing protein n=1 Tax=Periplaneta americana TaxID=6978 RepID=A0ABQ8SP67_PERAM|nr:hypothetical protein ANN_18146 [Periplaneta americana]